MKVVKIDNKAKSGRHPLAEARDYSMMQRQRPVRIGRHERGHMDYQEFALQCFKNKNLKGNPLAI